ncbi:shikimate O-hydroxycinnamoyltransferase-like [Gossypium australe]|uniref:Shikimate O-hydroxycinnamoyltransferase-like n=1 Tax=Gossypium australe TaxID=47621 RepID=A0A5B6XAN6_9ROSI|nr:shikimate O-hydroxycinnamoyltransferase-like [Gossypium australe]
MEMITRENIWTCTSTETAIKITGNDDGDDIGADDWFPDLKRIPGVRLRFIILKRAIIRFVSHFRNNRSLCDYYLEAITDVARPLAPNKEYNLAFA